MYERKTGILRRVTGGSPGRLSTQLDHWFSLGNSVVGHFRDLAGAASSPSSVNLGFSTFVELMGAGGAL